MLPPMAAKATDGFFSAPKGMLEGMPFFFFPAA